MVPVFIQTAEIYRKMQAVIFDLDGTLVELFREHYSAFKGLLKEKYGIEISEEEFKGCYGCSTEIILERLFKNHGIEADVNIPWFKIERGKKLKENLPEEIPPLPGAIELLEGLKSGGIKLALGTSNRLEDAEMILERAKLSGYFDEVSCSTEEIRGKPNPDIFLDAAEKLDTAPSECVVVEDSVNGIRAAKAAGMKAVAVLTGPVQRGEMELENPDLIADSLTEVDVATLQKLF